MDLDLKALRETFLAESEEGFATLETTLVALEEDAGNPELIHTAFRQVHTLKGGASIVGFTSVGRLAHAVEDLLDRVRGKAVPVTPSLVTALLRSVDALRGSLAAAVAGREDAEPADPTLFDELTRLAGEIAADTAQLGGSGADTASAPAPFLDRAPARNGQERRLAGVLGDVRKGGTLRVGIDKLDSLLNLTGEIAINRSRMSQLLEGGPSSDLETCRNVFREADQLFADLQEIVMQSRMVPLGPIFQHQRRLVRDQAEALGKRARVLTHGDDVEVDTRIVEHLQDPLMHLIRNALDHGLESPEARHSTGKDPCGTIFLSAAHEGGKVVLQVRDDGAGIDLDRVEAVARRRHLVAEAGRPTHSELLHVILEPGFSTADAVTDLSGRGVGLDVVRRNIETLRGTLTVASGRGAGTTFTIRLPLTLAIIAGFGVRCAGETFVIPLDCVLECLELPAGTALSEGCGIVVLREHPLPLVRLRDHLALGSANRGREHVIVVQHEGLRIGLVVDDLLGERQAVVKPFGRLLQRIPGLVGSAIEGDGRVSLILDVAEVVRGAIAARRGESSVEPTPFAGSAVFNVGCRVPAEDGASRNN